MISRFKKVDGTKNVRTGSLRINVEYMINVWSKKSQPFSPVRGLFLGYGSDITKTSNVIPRLNSNPSGNLYFECGDDILILEIHDCAVWCYDSIGQERRVTFSYDYEGIPGAETHKSKTELKQEAKVEKANLQYDVDAKIFEDKIKIITDNNMIQQSAYEMVFSICAERGMDLDKVADYFGAVFDKDGIIMWKDYPLDSNFYCDNLESIKYESAISYVSKLRGNKKINAIKFMGLQEFQWNNIVEKASRVKKFTTELKNLPDDKIECTIYRSNDKIELSNDFKYFMLIIYMLSRKQGLGSFYSELTKLGKVVVNLNQDTGPMIPMLKTI